MGRGRLTVSGAAGPEGGRRYLSLLMYMLLWLCFEFFLHRYSGPVCWIWTSRAKMHPTCRTGSGACAHPACAA